MLLNYPSKYPEFFFLSLFTQKYYLFSTMIIVRNVTQCYLSTNQPFRIFSERSCDIEDWSVAIISINIQNAKIY